MTKNQLAYWTLEETKRANLANEGIKRDTLTETMRSNLVNEDIKGRTLNETVRANQAKEFETNRTNVANESIRQAAQQLAEYQEALKVLNGYYDSMAAQAKLDKHNADVDTTSIADYVDILNVVAPITGLARTASKIAEDPDGYHNLTESAWRHFVGPKGLAGAIF